jgi:hypothetical protein
MNRADLIAIVLSLLLISCSPGAETPAEQSKPQLPAGPVNITGASSTHVVQGELTPIAMDRIEGLGLVEGKIVVRGAPANITLDPPQSADPSRPNRHWTLVSEADLGGKRSVTFTHDQSVEDFTLELPWSDAELHYGALEAPDATDVVVFASGAGGVSYWGYVTVVRRRK